MQISISTKSESLFELEVKETLLRLLERYELPAFTKEIFIESKVVAHSHPVLTLNTRTYDDEFLILEVYTHEQFHWFASDHENYSTCIGYLKKYSDLGDCNSTGNEPNSFWEHLIVCWNTRSTLNSLLSNEEVVHIYESWRAYPLTEKFVEENFEILRKDLEKFGMTWES